jgi:CubicO group peptidase (beta-lactamase class C family)
VAGTTPSTSAQVIARIKEKPLDFSPGQSFKYTNGGFMVAGYVVEQVSGQPYEKYLQAHIFEPLGMKNTGYAHDDSGLAVGYRNASTREVRLNGSLPFAAAGLYSTVEDLYLYTQALDSNRLLSQKSLDALFGLHKQADEAGGFGPDYQLPVYYGYGWAIASYNGHREIGHDGWIEGYGADVRRFPDDKFTMILLKNQSEPRAITFGDMIVEAIFKAK